jgi:predicted nucleic acid-binding protein
MTSRCWLQSPHPRGDLRAPGLMLWLLDRNIPIRLLHRPDPLHPLIRQALGRLWARGDRFCYTSQVLQEFRSVCTRLTTARGGFGRSLAETDRAVRLIERLSRCPR